MADDDIPAPPEGLTAKMELYCQLAMTGSYADAYRTAYETKPGAIIGPSITELNKHPKISLRMRQLQNHSAKKLNVTREWLLEWWFLRMTYDPREISNWAIGACRHCHGDGHNYQWREPEFMEAITKAELTKDPMPDLGGGFGFNAKAPPHPDCPKCDGQGVGRSNFADTSELSLAARAGFEGVKETRNGIEIKMADKDHAAEQFAKLSGWDVVQIRNITDPVPEDEALIAMAGDPIALAAAYKRLMTGGPIGSGRKH